MANKYGPRIIDDGLVLCIDAAGDNKSYPVDGLDVEYLIVAGGGAGGFRLGGGGGAGGLLYGSTQVTIASGTYSVVIGAGGASITASTPTPSNGSNSSFAGFTSSGGGGGGQYHTSYAAAANGGCGGGAASYAPAVRGLGTLNQGYNGGYGARNNITSNLPAGWNTDNGYSSGGGGGAGAAGVDGVGIAINAIPGDGGIGKYFGDKYSVGFGENGWFAGGGGGEQYRNSSINAVGGLGGGGRGAGGGYGNGQIQYTTPTNAQANTGGGGGGGGYYPGEGGSSGSGGSGIVLIRYSGPPRAKGGDSIISHRGYTVHVFTSSGNFIVGETVSDLSTSKNYGTLTNISSSDYTRGRSGHFYFGGSNEQISGSVGTSLNAPFTLEYVGRFSNTTRYDFEYFGSVGNYAGGQKSMISVSKIGTRFPLSDYHGNMYFFSEGPNPVLTDIALNTTDWIHIVLVALSTSPWVKVYKNGVQGNLISAIANSSQNMTGAVNTNGNFRIGTWSASTWWLDGDIALHKIYNIALSDDQISTNFNAIRGRYGI